MASNEVKLDWNYTVIHKEAYNDTLRKAEAVDAIKAEIEEKKNDHKCIGKEWSDDVVDGLQLALDIIDEHLKGESNDG